MAELGICDSIIVALQNASPLQTNNITSAGVLKALTSEQTMQTLEVLDVDKANAPYTSMRDDGTNFIPSKRVRWYQPETSASGTTKTCTASNKGRTTQIDFDVNLYRQRSFVVSKERLQGLCEQASQVYDQSQGLQVQGIRNTPIMNEIAYMLWSELRPLIRDINSDAFDALVANIGLNVRTGLNTASNVPVFNAAGTAFRLDGWTQVQDDFSNNELAGTPIIVGGSLFNRFQIALMSGSGSDGGFDYGKLGGMNPFEFHYDPTSDSKLATNDFLAIAPQSAALITHTYNKGVIGKFGTSEFGTFVIDELPEIIFDLQIKENDCDGPSYTIIPSLQFGVFTKPVTQYKAGDRLLGTNGILRYKAQQV